MIAIILAFVWPFTGPDPGPTATRTKAEARKLDCSWITPEEARRAVPGRIRETKARGDQTNRQIALCRQFYVDPALLSARDRAVVHTLHETALEAARLAVGARSELVGRTWLVEGFHPSAQISAKLTFATKVALVAQGVAVSDRTPALGASDLEVLLRLPQREAYPAACQRFSASGVLRPADALLGLVLRDPRETVLHAGVCADGVWTWLQ